MLISIHYATEPVVGYTTESVTHGQRAYGYLSVRRTLVLISRSAEDRRLSWPGWLVTYQDGVPAIGHPSKY